MTDVFVIVANRPDFLGWQSRLINKFLAGPYRLTVLDDSAHPPSWAEIAHGAVEAAAVRLGADYCVVTNPRRDTPNWACARSLNCLREGHVGFSVSVTQSLPCRRHWTDREGVLGGSSHLARSSPTTKSAEVTIDLDSAVPIDLAQDMPDLSPRGYDTRDSRAVCQ